MVISTFVRLVGVSDVDWTRGVVMMVLQTPKQYLML